MNKLTNTIEKNLSMSKKLFGFIIMIEIFSGKISFAQANKTLSNLTAPTSVNVTLLPGTDNSLNLGSSSKAWKSIYIKGNINLDGNKFVSNGSGGTGSAFVGTQAGNSDSSNDNTGVGYQALYKCTTGGANAANGYWALYSNTYGFKNSATGFEAMYSNTTGDGNVASGAYALYSNTIGFSNTATGEAALYSNTVNNWNTASGSYALYYSTGYSNTATGYEALVNNTSGYENTATGYLSGSNVITGSNNTFFGANANCGSLGTVTNATAIGNGATVTTNNHVVIGNSSVTSIGGFVNWSNISDGRVKRNIQENVPGLAFISKLRPVTYHLDLYAADHIIQRPPAKDKDGNALAPSEEEIIARKEKEDIVYSGFIAQDVEKAATEVNYNFSGVDVPQNDNSLYGLRYSDFVVPLVKSVQELSKQNDDRRAKITDLQNQLDQLKTIINNPSSNINSDEIINNSGLQLQTSNLNTGMPLLGQNISNPADNSSLIPFCIPKDSPEAFIIIENRSSGEIVKIIPISCNEDHIKIDAGILAGGTYFYSLYINGKMIDAKQFMLTK